MEINYGIIAVKYLEGNFMEVLHFCGYKEKPQKSDFDSLLDELKTDKTFELTETEFELIEASSEIVDYYSKVVNSADCELLED